jgi:hypothetical protein
VLSGSYTSPFYICSGGIQKIHFPWVYLRIGASSERNHHYYNFFLNLDIILTTSWAYWALDGYWETSESDFGTNLDWAAALEQQVLFLG